MPQYLLYSTKHSMMLSIQVFDHKLLEKCLTRKLKSITKITGFHPLGTKNAEDFPVSDQPANTQTMHLNNKNK